MTTTLLDLLNGPKRSGQEQRIQRLLAERLAEDGYEVTVEYQLHPGAIDIVAVKDGRTKLLELKIGRTAAAGIGQVLGYRLRWKGPADPVLAISEQGIPAKALMLLATVCRQTGVELWLVDEFGRYDRLEEAERND